MNFSTNELMKMKKKDLIVMIGNLSRERDEVIDELASAREELAEVETYEDEFHSFEIAKDIIERLKSARYKLDLGVMSEQEEIEKLNYKLEELFI